MRRSASPTLLAGALLGVLAATTTVHARPPAVARPAVVATPSVAAPAAGAAPVAPVVAPASPASPVATQSARAPVAVLKLTFAGGVAEAARELFAQRLVEGLAVAEFQVLAGATVTERLAMAGVDLGRCDDTICYGRAGQSLGVAYLVTGVVGERDRSYEIKLVLVNARTGVVIGTHRERCEICGVEEAGEKMGLAASALRTRLEALVRAPARFIIRSRPPGAAVAVDKQPVGRTPLDREIAGGAHMLELSTPGYDVLERSLTVVSGVDETLDLDLVPLPSKFPFRPAGVAALAVGVLALAAGIWAVAIDGNQLACTDAEKDDRGMCPHVRNTRVLGATLVGVGVGASALGGVWLYLGGLGNVQATEPGTTQARGLLVGGRF